MSAFESTVLCASRVSGAVYSKVPVLPDRERLVSMSRLVPKSDSIARGLLDKLSAWLGLIGCRRLH